MRSSSVITAELCATSLKVLPALDVLIASLFKVAVQQIVSYVALAFSKTHHFHIGYFELNKFGDFVLCLSSCDVR